MYKRSAVKSYEQGISFYKKGRLKDAELAYRKAIKIQRNFVEAHNNLGNVLLDEGRYREALRFYKSALELMPEHPMLLNNIGNVLQLTGDFSKAVTYFNSAITKDPGYADAHNNLGNTLKSLGYMEEAAASYRRAIDCNRNMPIAYLNLGGVLREMGKQYEALESFNNAITLKPDLVEAHNGRGNVLHDLGRTAEASECYERSIEINPTYTLAYQHLSVLKTYRRGDPQIRLMEDFLAQSELNDSDRMHLSFALAKAYDDIDEYDKSFQCLTEANQLRKKELAYEFVDDERLFSRIVATYSELAKVPVANEMPSAQVQPVFIVGMPRSGTSLVEQILASHSSVYGAGELGSMKRLVVPMIMRFEKLGATADKAAFVQNELKALRDGYLGVLDGLKVGEKVITDKMPLNFEWIGFILLAFPEAKIIHLNRDPVATCWSAYKHFFSSNGNKFSYDMQDVVKFYHLYLDLMSFWREQFPENIYDISYEALTENQEEETRRLLNFCNLEFEQQCLEFHKTSRAVSTASSMQVRQRMYTGSSEAWRKYEKHLRPITSGLQGIMEI